MAPDVAHHEHTAGARSGVRRRHLHVDPVTGVSGDMLLGALVDAGAPVDEIRDDLARLSIPGWSLGVERTTRHGITGSAARVTCVDDADHRSASELRRIIRAAALIPSIADRSIAVIDRIAAVEAAIHGVAVDEVHFHEVGALDTLVDVVGVCAAFVHLGIESASCSSLPTGSGTVHTAHGELPVPAPATVALLAGTGHTWRFTDEPMELVTPTGAALVAELTSPASGVELAVDAVGYGFGSSMRLARANCVRVMVGWAAPTQPTATSPISS